MRERDGLRVLSTHGWMAALSFECAKRRSILAHHAMLHLTSNDIMLGWTAHGPSGLYRALRRNYVTY